MCETVLSVAENVGRNTELGYCYKTVQLLRIRCTELSLCVCASTCTWL